MGTQSISGVGTGQGQLEQRLDRVTLVACNDTGAVAGGKIDLATMDLNSADIVVMHPFCFYVSVG